LSDILAKGTPPRVGESSEWTSIVSSAEENRANFCKILKGKPLFSALYGIYTLTLNELKAVLKVKAQAGKCGAVTKTSLELAAHDDDFQEVKRRKRHISNDTSQTAKKSITSAPKSAAGKLPNKTVITRNFFAPLRTNDMDTESTETENTAPEKEAPKKSGRPPPIVIADCLENQFTSHILCDENHERQVETTVKALLAFVSGTPLGKIRPCDVHNLANSLKLRKACGLDGIPNECLRHLPRKPLVHLTHLFNHCLRLSYFPKPWKEAKVMTLPKPGKDPKLPQNLRPISLLSTSGKLF
jgi:hypothetical protein